jgi:hypothetical protein
MRTVNLFKFSELSESAKKTAIQEVRYNAEVYDSERAYHWAIDDCSLFEPPHAEMAALLGDDYYDRNSHNGYGQFVFKNNRKGIHFNEEYLEVEISEALEITNDKMFKLWLGIPEIFHHIEVGITTDHDGTTNIKMGNPFNGDDPRKDVIDNIYQNAKVKFEAHIERIAKTIANGIEDYFSDSNIEERIEEDENIEFNEAGNIVKI